MRDDLKDKEISVVNKKNQKITLIILEGETSSKILNGIIDFNCFVKEGEKYLLVVKKGSEITSEIKEKIFKHEFILIEKEAYETYLKSNLLNIAKNKDIDLNKKSKIIYTSATNIVEDLFNNPNTENIQNTKQIVGGLLDEILTNDKALKSLMNVTSYDYYTYTHCVDVTIYSLSLGKTLRLSKEELEDLGTSAILHDIGKSKIDYNIVNKKGRLTDEEFTTMKQHPIFGYEIALENGITDERILSGIRHHHEKLDGYGYPDKLKKDDLTMFAQIVAVADIFDALTTRRSYKEAFSSFDALMLMKKEMSNQLNEEILSNFIKLLYYGDK